MMRASLRLILTGAAAALALGALTPAMAQDAQVHVLTVQLPGGGVEQIQYTGNVPPHVVLVPTQTVAAVPMFAADPFAALQRISAMMDQHAAAMLRQVQAMSAAPMGMMPGLPPGASGYSFVSTMSGHGVCARSVQITYTGGNATPKMVSSTSGDCGSDHGTAAPTEMNLPAPAPHPAPLTIEAQSTASGADAARQVAWNR
jgi:hypothetical protein